MAIGSALWYAGVSKAPGVTASAFMGVMPVSAVVLSYLLLGESFEWIHLIGMTAVLAGRRRCAGRTEAGAATKANLAQQSQAT
jgi:uncharacterized membrane protein